jgi:hypothetical protein
MKWLTKSDYLKFLIHPAYLWMQKHDKDRLPPFDDQAKAVMEQGNVVESYARKLYPDSVMVETLFKDAVDDTRKFVADDQKVIFQATVLTQRRLFCMADVFIKNDDGSWDLHEVKSATSVKETYLHDLAFQKIAFEESGYQINRCFLVHINNQYVRQGDIDPKKLFRQVNVTLEVENLLPRTHIGIEAALKVVASNERPDDDPIYGNDYYGYRDIFRYIHPDLTQDSIYNLCRLSLVQLKKLNEMRIEKLANIPAEFDLKPAQIAQLTAVKAGKPIINRAKIAKSLAKLSYPLYFFDYETVFPAVPAVDGTKPYQQLPFQYSLHILRKPDGKLEHREFLAEGGQNPAPDLLKQLESEIGATGSIISWNKSFEMGVNVAMADLYPMYKGFLMDVNARMYDLMDVFYYGYYIDAGFKGSASIKNVLPVIAPHLSYGDLAIQEGGMASMLWYQAWQGKMSPEDASKLYVDLRAYCGLDTLAMVEIHAFLMKLMDEQPKQLSFL